MMMMMIMKAKNKRKSKWRDRNDQVLCDLQVVVWEEGRKERRHRSKQSLLYIYLSPYIYINEGKAMWRMYVHALTDRPCCGLLCPPQLLNFDFLDLWAVHYFLFPFLAIYYTYKHIYIYMLLTRLNVSIVIFLKD